MSEGPGPKLSVIVPATAVHPTLSEALAAIEAGLGPEDELIVIDRPAGAWPSAARNSGARSTSHEVLVFVDADVIVHSDALKRIRTAFGADRSLTALVGSYDDSPRASGAASGFRNLLHHRVHQQAAGPVESFWTALGAVRRDAFLAAGGFDEGRRYLEDIDLGMRLARQGGRIALDPAVLGTHTKGWTVAEMLWTDFAHRGIPWTGLILRSREVPAALNLSWPNRLSALLSVIAAAALAHRSPRTLLAAALGMLSLNRSLYLLVLRRRGARAAAAAPLLHAMHHLAASASVPAGALAFARSRRRPVRGSGAPSGTSRRTARMPS